MSLRNLRTSISGDDLLHHRIRCDGMEVIVCRGSALPLRYQLAICQFRLAQFLALGWINLETLMAESMLCEPGCRRRPRDIHVLALDAAGHLIGYITAVPTDDLSPRHLDDPERSLYPVERVHGVRVIDRIPDRRACRTDQVWELKRFLHVQTMMMSSQRRLQVSLELFLGLFASLGRVSPQAAWVTGDAEEDVAVRHLRWAAREVFVIDGTGSRLASTDLYAPAYEHRDGVKPFLGRVPHGDELAGVLNRLERAALATHDRERVRRLIGQPEPLQRISA
jgi:hypothetical protein